MKRQLLRSALLGTAFGVFAASAAYAQGGGGELVIVANQEPQSMQAQVTYKEINSVGLRNVIEQLTRLDDDTGEVLPMLATSWEQVEPTVWHFKLREGITFHDGTPLTGEAAAVGISWAWSPDNNYDIRANMGPQITAEAVDESTVAVITAAPDPLLPKRMYLGGISSAKQILEDPGSYDVHPIGTGPYVFDEWRQGQFWTMKANPDWWGNTAGDTYGEIYFDSLRVVWRPEPIVRSAMVEGGEAHIAMFLTKEECARFDSAGGIKCMVKGSDTFLQFRLDYHGADPLLEDVNFRKAIFTGIDWDGIRQNLMGLGEPLAGQMLPSVATGFHDGIQQYRVRPDGRQGHRRRAEGRRRRDPEPPHLDPPGLDAAQRRDGRSDGCDARLRRYSEHGRRRRARRLQPAGDHQAEPGSGLCVAARAGQSADGLRRHVRRALLLRRHRLRVLRSRLRFARVATAASLTGDDRHKRAARPGQGRS